MPIVAPAHRIHTIHGSFGGPSFSSLVPASSSAQASSFNSLPNVSYASSRARASGLSVLNSRTSLSFTTNSAANGSLFTPRVRNNNFVAPVSTRRAPPPPPPKVETAPEDPFADMYSATDCVVVSLPAPHRVVRTQMPSQTSQIRVPPPSVTSMLAEPEPTPVPVIRSDERRAAKLVANVLLSRACGRPMRRRPMDCGEKTYVKSCLSKMVEVEA
ncbi:unnamed protein product [Somion occarium]|uniref:Uncharacterized protein n=1 Tax=Somion occarium TaxID=3059160 RepID=A0ABP1D7X3_9APHY